MDEMVDEDHVPRPHWRTFLADLAAMPAETLRRRSHFVSDAIASDGVTYQPGANREFEKRAARSRRNARYRTIARSWPMVRPSRVLANPGLGALAIT